jgi:hypothetical protein
MRDLVKRMRPENGDIILVRRWDGMTEDDEVYIIDMLKRRLNPSLDGVVCIFVDSLGDVRLLDEETMANMGWVRVDEDD